MFSPNAIIAMLAVIAVIVVFVFLQAEYSRSKNNPGKAIAENKDLAKDAVGQEDPVLAGKQEERDVSRSKEEVLSITEDDHVRGSKSTKVIMVIYSDFECPFCAKFAATIDLARERFKDDLTVVFRHYPLEFHLNAFPAAIASECSYDQGKFWEMHDGLMKLSREDSLTKDSMKNISAGIGLDQKKFIECFDSFSHKEDIAEEMTVAKGIGVEGTPHFFLNGTGYDGAYPFEDFERDGGKVKGLQNLILEELEKARQ